MDSSLDIKFKNLMNEYYPNKDDKLNPIFLSKTFKPFLFKKRKLKKPKSHVILPINNKTDSRQKNKSSVNIVFIKLKNTNKKERKNINMIKLKPFISKPLLINNSDRNIHYRSYVTDKKLISTDILQDKTFFKLGLGQLSINSLFNQENKNKKNEYFKKKISDIELNKLHDLQLTPSKEKKSFKKMTKFAMLNNLYHKYSSTSSGNIINNKNSDHYNDKYFNQENKKEYYKCNSPVYLTHYDQNKNFNFINIYKRSLNLPGINKNNNIIIDKDRKIYIDCLLSKVGSDINAKKIFPTNFGKTIYNLQKENGYIRIQNLDNVFSEIMKK